MEEVIEMRTYHTPGIVNQGVRIPEENDIRLDDTLQKRYRSGVGTLLYLVKHSRPDIANSVRELSKVIRSATLGNYRTLLRSIKYVIDTKFDVIEI